MAGWVLLVLLLTDQLTACPERCNCSLDSAGRRQLLCVEGGLTGSLPVGDIDPATQVLRINAPEDNENHLLIGPIFQGLQSLEEVHITHSYIPAIGKHSFWGVPTLVILNLQHNNITQVLDHNFRGLMILRELRLDWNAIESMTSATFQYLPELRVLTLAGNRLKTLAPRLFLKLGKLRTLSLSHNTLDGLDPQVFKDVQELRTFDCRDCNLSTMNPHMYSLLPSLMNLDLGDNQFKYLDREAFLDLRNLLTLRIDGNHFPVIMDGTFQSQAKLERLDLSRSEIAKVTNEAFLNLTSLFELDLSYNKLERLEPITMVPPGQSLKYLSISGNNIRAEEFTFVLQVTPKVRSLELADLDMYDGIPLGLLASVMGLKHLNLSGSRLTRFPVELLYPVTSLSSLDLSRNLLQDLDERAVSRLSYVAKVYLSGNPWLCDLCHVPAMLEADWSRWVVCSDPPELRGRTLVGLKITQLAPCANVFDIKSPTTFFTMNESWTVVISVMSVAVLLVILLVCLVVGLVCVSRRHAASYHTRRKEMKKEKKADVESRYRSKRTTVAVIDELAKSHELTPLTLTS